MRAWAHTWRARPRRSGRDCVLELNGRRLTLERGAREILFTPGAGDLPTMKLGIVYRAALDARAVQPQNHLVYRDGNYPERAGWKEVIAGTGPRVARARGLGAGPRPQPRAGRLPHRPAQ